MGYGSGDRQAIIKQAKGADLPPDYEALAATKPAELDPADDAWLQDLAAGRLPPSDSPNIPPSDEVK